MRPRAKFVLAITMLTIVATVASRRDAYLILEGADGVALWNGAEAYFFVGTRHMGHDVSYLRLPWFLFENSLAGPETPDDDLESLDVIRITSSGVKIHSLKVASEPKSPFGYAPRQGRIYTIYPALGGLCFWAGDHFASATEEDRQSFNGIEGLSEKHFDPGWSRREFGVGPGSHSSTLSIHVDEKLRLEVSNHTSAMGYGTISIAIQHPGKNPELIWEHVTRWGIVGKTDYQQLFREREIRDGALPFDH